MTGASTAHHWVKRGRSRWRELSCTHKVHRASAEPAGRELSPLPLGKIFVFPNRKDICKYLVVRSPFRAKHHVVVQYMAAGLKCPLPPSPSPPPPDPPPLPDPPHTDSMTGGRQGGQLRIDEQGRIIGLRTAVALSTASYFVLFWAPCLEVRAALHQFGPTLVP